MYINITLYKSFWQKGKTQSFKTLGFSKITAVTSFPAPLPGKYHRRCQFLRLCSVWEEVEPWRSNGLEEKFKVQNSKVKIEFLLKAIIS